MPPNITITIFTIISIIITTIIRLLNEMAGPAYKAALY
jgi:hypothetical protein